MKKLQFILYILFIILTAACSNKNLTENIRSADDYFQYALNSIIFSFDVENDKLYCVIIDSDTYETYIGQDGQKHSTYSGNLINVYNLDGTIENSYKISETIGRHCVAEGRIFFSSDQTFQHSFYEYVPDSQSSIKLCTTNKYYDVSKLEATTDKLYFLGKNNDFVDLEYNLASVEDSFTYSGERISSIDLQTGEIKDLPIDLPVSFSKAPDNNLIIYAYDEEKGYYFIIYNTKSNKFSDKIYHNLGYLTSFDVYNKNYDIVFLNIQRSGHPTLTAASIYPDKGKKELVQDFPLTAILNIACWGDYTYSTDVSVKNIIRVKNSAYLKSNKQITMYSSARAHLSDVPFGCGYNIKHDSITKEELALAILSQDPNFDLCSLNSSQDISANIRNKGSFYPLNDVKGVKEYLDLCFPYVKEAAINSDGDIWMLPIYVDIPCILYNESFCQSKGIYLSNPISFDKLINIIDRIKKDASLSELYNTYDFNLIRFLFYRYLRSYTTFNTDLFKKLASTCKNTLNYTHETDNGNNDIMFNIKVKRNSNFLLLLGHYNGLLLSISENDQIRASGIPNLTDDVTNVGTCYFLTVNPASKNLKETLQYISSLCNYLINYNYYLILKDRSLYPDTQLMDDIYEIYSNGDICFTYPDELFMDAFEKYLADEMDLDSFIKEADRRLDTFLKE